MDTHQYTGGLLAVDLGLRMGWALFTPDGYLRRYGAHNFGSRKRLRTGCKWVLDHLHPPGCLFMEGGGSLARAWLNEAHRRGLSTRHVGAETWRADLLPERARHSADTAKQAADQTARRIIAWSGAKRPTTLRHDAAEAICLGMWGVLVLGWIPEHTQRKGLPFPAVQPGKGGLVSPLS
ncbi:MAG: hypothetical protein ACQESV_01140 [Thermodesulfobacteriota bacterium]